MENVALCIRADYARLVYGFTSTEETRYYLNGFASEPAPEGHTGAILAATDGHRIGIMRDEEGFAEATPRIWQLSKETLKACKPAGRDTFTRWLIIVPTETGNVFRLTVVMADLAAVAVAIARNASAPALILHTAIVKPVDGTFPDFRRCVPQDVAPNDGGASFDHKLMAPFVAVAAASQGGSAAVLGLRAVDDVSPAYVLTGRSDFIGVIMPRPARMGLDRSWLDRVPAAAADQAAE